MSVRALMLVFVSTVLLVSCSQDREAQKRQRMEKGDQFFKEKNYPAAVIEYRNAVSLDDKFGEARLKLAQSYAQVGDIRNAINEGVRAADLLPQDIDAQVFAGQLLIRAQQYDEAQARARTALQHSPKHIGALVLLGNALARLDDLDGAIKQVEEAIAEDPTSTLAFVNLGGIQLAKGDREAAESTLKRAIATDPKSVMARLAMANFYWSSGDLVQAERELKLAVESDPKSLVPNRALSAFYLERGKVTEAEPYLKAYVEADPDPASRLLLADYYVRINRIDDAKATLSALTGDSETRAAATARLAGIDASEGNRQAAYARLDRFLKDHPKALPVLEAKARLLLLDGKAREALDLSTAFTKEKGDVPSAKIVHANALEANGRLNEALAVFQELRTEMPTSIPLQIKTAQMMLRVDNPKGALTLAEGLVKAQPTSVQAHLIYGQALLRSGEVAAAERELVAVQKSIPPSADLLNWLGLLYEQKREFTKARDAYTNALKLDPKSMGAVAGLVSVDLAEKKPEAALARIESLGPHDTADVRLASLSAHTYVAVRDLPKAETAFRRVLQLEPNNAEAYGRLGAIYLNQNRLDEAKTTFEEMLRRDQDAVIAETMIGNILLHQNKPLEARARFESAIKRDPRAAVAANNLAWDYSNSGGNLDIALQLAQSAKEQMPDSADFTDTLGWVYYKRGMSALAVSTFEEALQKSPSSPGILYHLGLAQIQAGNTDAARRTLEKAMSLKPQGTLADDTRKALESIRGNGRSN